MQEIKRVLLQPIAKITVSELNRCAALMAHVCFVDAAQKAYILALCARTYVAAYCTEEAAASRLLRSIDGYQGMLDWYANDCMDSEIKPPKGPAFLLTAWARLQKSQINSQDLKKYYQQAQAFGCAYASYFLVMLSPRPSTADDPLVDQLRGIGSDDPRALTELGLLYYKFYKLATCSVNDAKAYFAESEEWLGIAAGTYEDPVANYWLGIVRYNSILSEYGSTKSQSALFDRAGKYWKKAAEREHPDALFVYRYAKVLASGSIQQEDLSAINLAATKGSAHAKTWLIKREMTQVSCPEEFSISYLNDTPCSG